jgi:hypothetical protein
VTWRLDHAMLDYLAHECWGIRWPVYVVRRPYRRWHGWHTVVATRGGWAHSIRFTGRGGVECALRTLAHELEHAAQAERLGVSAFRHCYLTDSAGFERIAATAEERWRELLPAVKGVPE